MGMTTAMIVFIVLAILCLGGVITMFAIPKKVLRDDSKWKVMSPENIAAICGVLCFAFIVVSILCCINRCDNCDSFRNTKYCQHCGIENVDFVQSVNNDNHIAEDEVCKNCGNNARNTYCGYCGTKVN